MSLKILFKALGGKPAGVVSGSWTLTYLFDLVRVYMRLISGFGLAMFAVSSFSSFSITFVFNTSARILPPLTASEWQ